MPDRVIVIDTGYDSYAFEEQLFAEEGYRFDLFPGDVHDRAGKIKFSKEAAGLLIRWTDIDDEFLDALPQLRAIARYGVGFDNIDVEAASRHNVKVSNVQGYANDAVSDHALALMYAFARAIPQGQESIRTQFGAPPTSRIIEFHDKTLGIIGLGRIGGTLCTKARSLFKEVIAADPYIPDERFEELGAVKTNLEKLLVHSDVISIHCNLTEETTGLINAQIIQKMRKTPILINTARGPVINEDDLLEGLQAGKIHSAGLDVFCDEPPLSKQDELLSHSKVIATGHYAWYSETSAAELQKRAARNLLLMLKGQIPEDCLNPLP
jgi:D-3-phosphoglycerate dehydrogenase